MLTIFNFFFNSAQDMRCGNRPKFGADRSKTKLSKNRQSMTSVYWRVGLKGLSAKNQQKLFIPQKTFAESMSWVPLKKGPFYACFLPQNRPMPEKCGLKVYSISHNRLIFAHIQVGGQGEQGWGKSCWIYKTGRKSIHGKNMVVYSLIVGLTDLWAVFTWRCSI